MDLEGKRTQRSGGPIAKIELGLLVNEISRDRRPGACPLDLLIYVEEKGNVVLVLVPLFFSNDYVEMGSLYQPRGIKRLLILVCLCIVPIWQV